MLDVTVKTLDGKNRSFSVPEEITVKEFKEKIANSIEIPADRQRLIFQGRVLLDEKKLNFYDVHGKVIHVVQRAPPSTRPPASSTTTSPGHAGLPHGMPGGITSQNGSSVVISSFSMPSDSMDPQHVQNIVQETLSGMGDIGRNAQVSSRPTEDGTGLDVHINLGDIHIGHRPPHMRSESHNRIRVAQKMINEAQKVLDKLENPDEHPDSPMDTSSEQAEGGGTRSEEGTSTASTDGAQSSTTEQENSDQNQPQHPSPSVLSELLDEVFRLNQRLQPHLERYQQILSDDPPMDNETERTGAQRLCDRVPEAMHYIGHAYHNISDIMMHLDSAPPRQLRATPVAIGPVAVQVQRVVRHAIPVVAELNIGQVPMTMGGPVPSTPASAAATPTANTGAQGTTSNTATSTTNTSRTRTTTAPIQPNVGVTPGVSQVRFGPPPPFAMGQHGAMMVMEMGPDGNMRLITHGPVGNTNTPPATSTAGATTQPQTGGAQNRPTGPTPPMGPMPHLGSVPPFGPMPPMGAFQVNAGGVQPPPPFVQNLMQAVSHAITQQGGPGGGPGPSSTVTSSTTSTRTTTTTASSGETRPTNTGPRPSTMGPPLGGPGLQGLPPGIILGGPPNMGGFGLPHGLLAPDPTLPCQSRFFANRRLGQVASGIGQDANANQTPDQAVASAVSNIIMGLSGQGGSPGAPPVGTQATTSSTPTSTNSEPSVSQTANVPPVNPIATAVLQGLASGGQGSAQPVQIPSNLPFMDSLRTMLQQNQPGSAGEVQASAASATLSQTPAQQGHATPPAGGQVSDEVFAQLVRGISGYMTQAAMGQQPQDTIGDFLDNLGQSYQISQGEGFLTDIFNCLARHMTFVDLMSIFFGQTEPLNNVRVPLQGFVRERVLQGQDPTELNVSVGVDRVLQEMQEEVRTACANVQVKEDIDFPATVTLFLKHQMQDLVKYIMAAEDNATFGQPLYNRCRLVVHKFVVLCRRCLQGGLDDLDRIVQQYVRRASTDVNPMIQQWMANMTASQIRNLAPGITVTDDQILQYVVRHGQMEVESSAPDAATNGPHRVQQVASCQLNNEHMDIDLDGDNDKPEDEVRERTRRTIRVGRTRGQPPPKPDSRDLAPVELGSEPWHAAVPREWVSVISRDVSHQARDPPCQAPYSDAYLDIVPSKRRKVLTEGKPQHESGDLPSVLPEALKAAAGRAGVEPITSPEQMAKEAAENKTIQQAYGSEVQKALKERIQTDPDYIPDKYPNCEKYYKGKK